MWRTPTENQGNIFMSGICDGRVVVITGAARGIGRAHALAFAAEGAKVVVNDLGAEVDGRGSSDGPAGEVVDDIRGMGGEAVANGDDVSDWDGAGRLIQTAIDAFGGIDVLVNNAGINPAHMSPTDMTLEFWRKVFSVNLEGPLRMAQQVAPIMRDGGGGSIVNIGTMAAYGPGPGICAYGASKAGLLNLTKAMAMDWARWNIRVNLLSPGPFTSEMLLGAAAQDAGYLDMVANGTYLKRVADPSEIVGPVLYLASDASSFVTGDDLSVSGGMMK